jgi:hypothetical protein
MKRKIIDLDAEIMAWAEEHDIQLNEEIKFWKIKTSYISILNKFLYFGADKFDWTDIKYTDEKPHKYIIDGFAENREFAKNTIIQFIRIGYIFGVLNISGKIDGFSSVQMFKAWLNRDIQITVNPRLRKYSNIPSFLETDRLLIIERWKEISQLSNKTALKQDLTNILLTIFFSYHYAKYDIEKEDIETAIGKYIQKETTKMDDFHLEYKSNLELGNFYRLIVED